MSRALLSLLVAALPQWTFSAKELRSSYSPSQEQHEPVPPEAATKPVDKKCMHGDWDDASKTCNCWKHWKTAGITDTIDFIEGSCEQFQCESNEHCQEKLGLDHAECPVEGWNCYCGWEYAFKDGWHGWDPRKDGLDNLDGECMGVMYTFSVDATRGLTAFLEWAWIPFVILAVIALPFGRKRAVCDHHRPSMWNYIRRCFRCQIECTGGCVMSSVYTADTLKDDLAWTIYILDLMVWLYLFTCVLCITVAWICSLVVWLVILLILLIVAVAGVCMACVAGLGGEAGSCDIGHCDCCHLCGDAGGAGAGDGAAAGGAECCDCCGVFGAHEAAGAAAGGAYEPFYWGGPWPYDPYMGYLWWTPHYATTGREECCCCCDSRNRCCNFLCKPVAALLFVFPVMPENAWGGLLGFYVFGTHHMTPAHRIYQGGNCFVDALMGRRPADLHANTEWRIRVHDFLVNDEDLYGHGHGDGAHGHEVARPFVTGEDYHQSSITPGEPRIETIGGSRHCHAVYVGRKFDMEEDRAWESSFDDYTANKCWICQDRNDEWDLWISCRHMFCKDCSTKMLRRRMPCPLCRVYSCAVLRGVAYDNGESDSGQAGSSNEHVTQQLSPSGSTQAAATSLPPYGRGYTRAGTTQMAASRDGAL